MGSGSDRSQIAEALGGVSRNAVIGKAHRLGLQARPSPVRANEPAAAEAPAPTPVAPPPPVVEPEPEPVRPEPVMEAAPEPVAEPTREPQPVLRSVGPGGFVRQSPGEQQPPPSPAPPRRLVPAKRAPRLRARPRCST
ncbi:Uncharacterized protein conserved in bacteria [Sphingomonas paucimobilis]|nr:Uncharacterized protein conserved in bacteria [Sphingomonas paucimobilis]